MGRYLNHSRHMDYTKNMAEHIYMTEKMKPTDKQKKFLECWKGLHEQVKKRWEEQNERQLRSGLESTRLGVWKNENAKI